MIAKKLILACVALLVAAPAVAQVELKAYADGNGYLDVQKLVTQLGYDAGLVVFQRSDQAGDLAKEGKASTTHVLVARRMEDMANLPELAGWNQISQSPGIRGWTDDFSSLLDLVRWH